MRDNEIIKALECCSDDEPHFCSVCPYYLQDKENDYCREDMNKDSLSLINRQKAEIEELVYKLECLLCHATGGKLSKHTYPLNTMYSAVNDEVQDCCDCASAEAIKEFAERLKEKAYIPNDWFGVSEEKEIHERDVDALVKEMVGDDNG